MLQLSVTNLGATVPIPVPLQKQVDGGSIVGCPLAGALPAGLDGFPSYVQHDVNEATEGK